MTADFGPRGRTTGLTDRHAESGALRRLFDAVRTGESRALVIRGDPGVGKTALLDFLAGRASNSGCRIERAAGVQSEMELVFSGLHQLCVPRQVFTKLGISSRGQLKRVMSEGAR